MHARTQSPAALLSVAYCCDWTPVKAIRSTVCLNGTGGFSGAREGRVRCKRERQVVVEGRRVRQKNSKH